MEKRWKNLNVGLQQLTNRIENFYSRRDLKVKTNVLEDGYSIRVVPTELRMAGFLEIVIRGTPDDFTVETKAAEREDNTVKIGLMTTVFGGGSLVLSSVLTREKLEKMEREFWGTIEETIRSLTNLRQYSK